MRTVSCNYCTVNVTAPNYSQAQSLIVEHNYREHFTIQQMTEDWAKGNRAVATMFRCMMERTGFNEQRMMKTLEEDGYHLFVEAVRKHREYLLSELRKQM